MTPARSTDSEERTALLARIDERLGRPWRQLAMFGTKAVMLEDKMIVAVHRDGRMLVRVRSDDDALVARPEASRAEMGPSRSMGPGWVSVAAEPLTDDAVLAFWLDEALEHWGSARA